MFHKTTHENVTTSENEDFNKIILETRTKLDYVDEVEVNSILIERGYTPSDANLIILSAKILNKFGE